MRNPLLLLFVSLLSTGALHSAEILADHQVSDVLLYPDRALVTRSADLQLSAGEHQIVLGGLPYHLDEASVRARATGKNLTIQSVEVKQDYIEEIDNEETRALKDQIEGLEFKSIDLSDERNVLNEKKKLLQDLSNKAGETAEESDATAISVTDLKELVDYYSSQTQDIALRLRGIERETTELREEINRLRRQLKEIQNPGKPQTRKIIVMAKADQGTRSQIQVDYLIGNAGWQPQYDIHASSDSTEIELTTYGVIRQRTGEDWEDVNLTLSTARPSVGTAIPELTPWTLDFFKPVERPKSAPADSYRSLAVAKSEVRSNYLSDESQVLEGEAELLESAQVMTSVIQSRGFNAVYVVPAKMSAPSDGEPHRCTVSIQKMESKRSYVSRPKLSRLVFMKATVTNANEAPLLPGQMNTFVDNDYIGRSYLNLVGPKGNFDLSLGQDDSIKVTRKEKVRKEDTRGILSRDRENQLGYTIEIENFKEEAVQLELEDQIPVSKDGQILVKAKKISPQPDKTKKETGKLTWNLELAGRQKKTIEVEFTVSHPPGQSIDGL